MLKRLFRQQDPSGMLSPNLSDGWERDEWRSWEAPVNLIVGESHYEATFHDLAGSPRREGYLKPVLVILMRDPGNPYDSNAVRAEVGGHPVGYVGRATAAILAPRLDRLGITSLTLAGVIRGGSTSAPNFGVHIWTERRATSCP